MEAELKELQKLEPVQRYGFIDRTGKIVIPLRFEDVQSFSEGRAGVKLAGKWGYIDKNGVLVIPAAVCARGGLFRGFGRSPDR